MPKKTELVAPDKLESFAVIIRCTWANGDDDQRACLAELYRRGLWLSDDQTRHAIAASGRAVPDTVEGRKALLAEMGYKRT